MLRCADLEMDDDAHRVRAGRREVALSPTEYNLLRYLLVNQGRVLSKAQILDHVWQYDFGGDGGVVETYIGYLRRKVDNGRAPADPHHPRRRLHAARPSGRCRCAARLLVGMAVVAVVLVGAAVIITRTTEAHLVDQVDAQLDAAGPSVRDAGFDPRGRGGRPGRRRPPERPQLAVRRRRRRRRRASTLLATPNLQRRGPRRPGDHRRRVLAGHRDRRAVHRRQRTPTSGTALPVAGVARPAGDGMIVVGLPLDDVDAAVEPARAVEVVGDRRSCSASSAS